MLNVLLSGILAVLAPRAHGDFDHYTFAETWQPGICQTEEGCVSSQPRVPLIGLHGLWASLPAELSSEGVENQQWWSRGCDFYHHSDDAPPLPPGLREQIEAVMPQFEHDLLTHEYDKHVQCFGFDPPAFFSRELAMRAAVASSSFGAYLVSQMGREVDHGDVIAQFQKAFGTAHASALQLECRKNHAGTTVFTQFWITIPTAALASFPAASAFMDTPVNQDTCPARFLIPAWQK
jgi:ribonuclease I